MQQHAVPQNVTSFEFKIVGFLTLKQFAMLGVCSVIAFICFLTITNVVVRIVSVLFFAGLGVLLAFGSIQQIPFYRWIFIFIKAIFSPTQRIWIKTVDAPAYLSAAYAPAQVQTARVFEDKTKLNSYLQTLSTTNTKTSIDVLEQQRLSALGLANARPAPTPNQTNMPTPGIFSNMPSVPTSPPPQNKPQINNTPSNSPIPPVNQPKPAPQRQPQLQPKPENVVLPSNEPQLKKPVQSTPLFTQATPMPTPKLEQKPALPEIPPLPKPPTPPPQVAPKPIPQPIPVTQPSRAPQPQVTPPAVQKPIAIPTISPAVITSPTPVPPIKPAPKLEQKPTPAPAPTPTPAPAPQATQPTPKPAAPAQQQATPQQSPKLWSTIQTIEREYLEELKSYRQEEEKEKEEMRKKLQEEIDKLKQELETKSAIKEVESASSIEERKKLEDELVKKTKDEVTKVEEGKIEELAKLKDQEIQKLRKEIEEKEKIERQKFEEEKKKELEKLKQDLEKQRLEEISQLEKKKQEEIDKLNKQVEEQKHSIQTVQVEYEKKQDDYKKDIEGQLKKERDQRKEFEEKSKNLNEKLVVLEVKQKDSGSQEEVSKKFELEMKALMDEKKKMEEDLKAAKAESDAAREKLRAQNEQLITEKQRLETMNKELTNKQKQMLEGDKKEEKQAAPTENLDDLAAQLQNETAKLDKTASGPGKIKNETMVSAPTVDNKDEKKTKPLAPPIPQPAAIQETKIITDLAVAKIPPITNLVNVINGVVYDKNGNFVSNVIIIVKDVDKSPVRALKSNRLGQFAISTPLPNGTYTMEFEDSKEEQHFDIYQVTLMGNVIPPIEIKEKA